MSVIFFFFNCYFSDFISLNKFINFNKSSSSKLKIKFKTKYSRVKYQPFHIKRMHQTTDDIDPGLLKMLK